MKKRVLLVDDESSIRRTLTLSLNQEGYDVEPCDTGINALKKLETYEKNDISFDTIILDIKLPDIDGIKLGKIIKSKYPDSIIIFISGYANSLNLKEIANLNSTTFIEKPFTTQDLTYQFNELSKEKGVSTQVAEEENSETVKTVSAYALLKLKKDANFIEIYKELFFMKELFYCDALKSSPKSKPGQNVYSQQMLPNTCSLPYESPRPHPPCLNGDNSSKALRFPNPRSSVYLLFLECL
jgi:CheY-like chemotaxis protein